VGEVEEVKAEWRWGSGVGKMWRRAEGARQETGRCRFKGRRKGGVK
jgi:hypothetical protein